MNKLSIFILSLCITIATIALAYVSVNDTKIDSLSDNNITGGLSVLHLPRANIIICKDSYRYNPTMVDRELRKALEAGHIWTLTATCLPVDNYIKQTRNIT